MDSQKLWYDPYFKPAQKFDIDQHQLISELAKEQQTKPLDFQKILDLCINVIVNFPKVLEARTLFVEYAIRFWIMETPLDSSNYCIHLLKKEYRYFTLGQFERSRFEICFKVIEDGLNYFPNDKDLLNFKGICLYILGMLNEAADAFDLAAAQNLEWVDPLLNKAIVLGSLKKYEEVLNLYESLKVQFPKINEIKILKGELYTKLFLFPNALKEFESVFAIDQENLAKKYANIARVKFLQRDFQQAKYFFEKATSEDSDEITSNLFYGDFLSYNKQWLEALFKYENFVKRIKIHRDAFNKLRHVKDERSDSEFANVTLNMEIKSLTNYELDFFLWSANDFFRQGKYQSCLEFLKKLREIRPANPEICLFIAKIHFYFNDCKSGISELQEGLAFLNSNPLTFSNSSSNLIAYKTEIRKKQIQLFNLMISIANIQISNSEILHLQAKNALIDSVFRLYKGKLMLKCFCLPKDELFEINLNKIFAEVEDFKSKLSDFSSWLYIPNFAKIDEGLFVYYNILLKKLLAFEKINNNQCNGLKEEAQTIEGILNDIELLVEFYPPTSQLTKKKLGLSALNLRKLEDDCYKRLSVLEEIAKSITNINADRIHRAFKNKEISLFLEEGIFGRYSRYFFNEINEYENKAYENLAKIDSLKLLLILYRASYLKDSRAEIKIKVHDILELSKIQFQAQEI